MAILPREAAFDFFNEHAKGALTLVFKPMESSDPHLLAYSVVMRLYAMEILVPPPSLHTSINAWVRPSDTIPITDGHEYVATVRHQVLTPDHLRYDTFPNAIPIRWYVGGSKVNVHEGLANSDVVSKIKKSLPIELFFVHQTGIFEKWKKLRAKLARQAAKQLITDQIELDGQNYY